ncbi:MAG TPA: alcohol dehydrogenase catalytic domain-containing protein [Chloroflexota bacterium]|jgi:threonine dehydrogenase-like Zn-dependent dehydrogenase
MKAAFKVARERLELREVPTPAIGPGDCLVRIGANAICASDRWWGEEGGPEELVRGHEIAGTVVEVGAEVERWRPGDRVGIYIVVGCGRCGLCGLGLDNQCPARRGLVGYAKELGGGLAEYIAVAAGQLLPVPERVGTVEASLLTDTLGTPMRALRRSGLRAGDAAVVWGLGPLGLVAVQGARLLGARSVLAVDPIPRRAALARALGADNVIDPTTTDPVAAVRAATGGPGADVVLNTVAAPGAAQQAYDAVRLDGTLQLVTGSPTVNSHAEKRVNGTFYFGREEYGPNVELVTSDRLRLLPTVTHTFPLEDVQEAYRVRFKEPHEAIKVVVTME